MTTIGDTPTTTKLKSEEGVVSIKIEQGVLCKNDEYEGRSLIGEKVDIPEVKRESTYTPDTENNSNNFGDNNFNMFNITHSIFQPDFEIKTEAGFNIKAEPDVDIDDRQPEEEAEGNTRLLLQSPHQISNTVPKIRLTPTSKLMAPANGSTSNKKRYACPYENCTKSYGKSSHLRSHLTWHSGIKPFVCKEAGCGKGFTRSDELYRHIRTHTGEKPFECVQCTKKFSRSDHLTKHFTTHTKKLGANGTLPRKIKKEKHLSQSSIKTASTVWPVAAKTNQNTKPMNIINTSIPKIKKNPEIIADRLESPKGNNLNIKLEKPENSGEYIIVMVEQKTKDIPHKTVPAQQLEPCSKKEFNIVVKTEPVDESYARELDEPDDDAIMPEANLPPLTANAVAKLTDTKPKQIFNHVADSVYDPTRPYPCYQCTKNFKRQDDLNRHMRTHTGEKPFACNECDKRFMRSDHLKKHMNTHIRVR